MTAKAALCFHMLKGDVLNVGSCFKLIGLTNCAREISRMVEEPFGVTVSRDPVDGNNRYGSPCNWINYRLNHSEHNLEGIEKMKAYIRDQCKGHPEESKMLKYCQPSLL